MKPSRAIRWAAVAAVAASLPACQDSLSGLGGSLAQGEVTILVDSITANVPSRSVETGPIDGRTSTKLLGNLAVPEYGRLDCSFVSQMMCAAAMPVPDSISVDDVDSIRLVLSVPRGALTGDSLAPQQLAAYRLDRPLPADITSAFDPAGYYTPDSLMGTAAYTLSNVSRGDSAMKKSPYIRIPVKLPLRFGREIFSMYRAGSPVFDWPSTFNDYFKGVYVAGTFGSGCVANISKAEIFTYWKRTVTESVMQPDSTYANERRTVRDSVCLMASQPEVLSSNIIDYRVSDALKALAAAEAVATTPGGYRVEIDFPAQSLLDMYHAQGASLSVVSSLKFEIPATAVRNDYGITVAPAMLMVRRNELDSFFAENKIPDGTTSFYASYDTDSGSYRFNTMRQYFLDLLEKEQKGEGVGEDDTAFVLVPVDVTTETVESYNTSTTYVTRCAPYLLGPTMTRFHTDRCAIVFTYSTQRID